MSIKRVNDIPIAGGKAANLGELTSAGFEVPPGFVLTTEVYDYFLKHNDLEEILTTVLATLDVNSDVALQEASANIRKAFEQGEVPRDLEDAIVEEYKKLGKGSFPLVAVRSSATAEDLPTASFAGQQDTYLNVPDPKTLIMRSRNAGPRFYPEGPVLPRIKNFEHDKVKLAVVIQRMVNSEFSGIMFTIDPNSELPTSSSRRATGWARHWWGKVTPDTYVVDKFHRKILNKRVSNQTWKPSAARAGES